MIIDRKKALGPKMHDGRRKVRIGVSVGRLKTMRNVIFSIVVYMKGVITKNV